MSKMLGILGGMGAFAGLRLLDYALRKSKAKSDSDFPKVLFYNLPIEGMDEHGISDRKKVHSQLRSAIGRMESFGCHYIVMACNTAHLFYGQLQGVYSGSILNMIDVACSEINGDSKIGLMCSETTKTAGIYHNAIKSRKVSVIDCDTKEQVLLNGIIKSAISGQLTERHEHDFQEVAINLRERGATRIIVGCTELPMAINNSRLNIPLIDAGKVTIDAALSLL